MGWDSGWWRACALHCCRAGWQPRRGSLRGAASSSSSSSESSAKGGIQTKDKKQHLAGIKQREQPGRQQGARSSRAVRCLLL
jgi:hypothetical protein